MTDPTPLLLEADELDRAATPGPWRVGEEHGQPAVFPTKYAVDCPVAVCDPLHHPGDAAFIARSRTLLPAIASVCREQAAEIERLREEVVRAREEERAAVVALVRARMGECRRTATSCDGGLLARAAEARHIGYETLLAAIERGAHLEKP